MHLHQFLHQCEPDPAAFVAAPPCPVDAPEALKEIGKIAFRDARSGVAYRNLRLLAGGSHTDPDLSVECGFERVRDEIENDLLPHLPVHIHRFWKGWAVHHQSQPGPLHCGAKDAGKLCRQQGKIGGLIRCAQLSDFDADKVQQPVHEFEQPEGVAVQHLKTLGRGRRLAGKGILDRTQNEGKRGS